MPPVLFSAGAGGFRSLSHALDEISLTATMSTPTIVRMTTAPRIAAYSSRAAPVPVYSAMVGARIVATTITETVIAMTAPTMVAMFAIWFPSFHSVFLVCVTIDRNDYKAEYAE